MNELMAAWMGTHAIHEMGKLLDESRGRETPPTMADRLSWTVLENWIKEETTAVGVSSGEMRRGRTQPLLWRVGLLLIRGGQRLQERHPVETVRVEA